MAVLTPLLVAGALGLTLGVRHAFEPDHLAAVSVLNTERPVPRAGLILGAMWGLGHSAALVLVSVLLTALGVEMPPQLSASFELVVAVMLVVLGGRALLRAADFNVKALKRRDALPSRSPAQAFGVGLIHGLAGSGTLTAFAAASLPALQPRLAFMLIFALGSTIGMSAMSGGLGWPLARLGDKPAALRWMRGVAGAAAVVCGVWWGWPLLAELHLL
jgi:High-affinity nickel-transport protein